MLVLSRRVNQKIVFSNLDITVQILRVAGNVVRVGIDAPRDVDVLREELAGTADATRRPHAEAPAKLSHAMRNRLYTATLALHLSKRQLERDLRIEAESSLDKAIDELERLNREVLQPATATRERHAASRRALVVEDDRNESELLAGYLRLTGFDVDQAQDGQDALDYLSSHEQPDFVLLDMLMPRCDGPTTIAAIRANPALADLRVFALSGTDPHALGVPVGPRGIDRWFAKPINPQILVNEITSGLASPRAASHLARRRCQIHDRQCETSAESSRQTRHAVDDRAQNL